MAPCNPNDLSIPVPDGPSGPSIPGFGTPFIPKGPNLNPFPEGFPEDILELFNQLQLLIPPGALKPQLNPNYGKDVFDAIMKLLDQFMPFLMLYKFFLPVLELIICIIEVLCALMNPFKLVRALNRLFTQCIPAFLNLFPIFALVIMIISLLLLILALIEYIVAQIIKFIEIVTRNILALQKSFADGDAESIKAIALKLGSLLCIFQNLFVLFAIFNIIIQVIKDILALVFAIPPCEDSAAEDLDGCCTPDVCPSIVKEEYTRTTGTLQYLNKVGVETSVVLPPQFGGAFSVDIRPESWQIYDIQQPIPQQFKNIYDGYDVPVPFGLEFLPFAKPVFFPTALTYTAESDPKQAPYVLDLRLFYNPANWGRPGLARYVRFTNCIMLTVPSSTLTLGNLLKLPIPTAVASIAGGFGYEDDGYTKLTGFDTDGVTPIDAQATLNNFLHKAAENSTNPSLSITDGYTFQNIEYTFRPNIAPLLATNLVTLGCAPDIAINRTFVNNVFAGDIALKTQLLRNLLNNPNFTNPGAAQQCLSTAVANLSTNMTLEGAAEFQTTTTLCLQKLKDDTNSALGELIGIGFDPCKSSFTLEPKVQFTTKPIIVSVSLNERNGLSLTAGLSEEVAANLADRISPHITFGEISRFSYDGYQAFTAELTSKNPGSGSIMISFDNNTLCNNKLPETGDSADVLPEHTLQSIDYQFIYAPYGVATDSDGKPRRDAGDVAITGLVNPGNGGG
jgi:hypothetical protein